MAGFSLRGIWCSSHEAGTTRESVCAFLDKLQSNGINAFFMCVKHGNGTIAWPSERFPELVQEPYKTFDLPAVLQEECAKRDIQPHAWFFDFFESEKSLVYERHPEWAMRDRMGNTTAEEILRGRRFGGMWMCPAQRPGYTDQWLIPLYADFADRYQWTSIHHDYVRYPGDMAPDQYCFCDYCLENIPRFNSFIHESYPDEPFYHPKYDREYLEAHWEPSPRVLPANWDKLPRHMKADFLREGQFFQGGRYDLDYFFYTYRTHWITEFTRECHAAVKAVNPQMKLSGAIFKNPIHSGRFIGQDWRTFAPYMEITIPMDYRDHFPGTFEQYLGLLEETIHRQKEWARDFEALYIGIATNFLFFEEPEGPYPPEKMRRVIETIESTGVPGMVIFCNDQLDRYGMWDVVRAKFVG